MSLDDLCKLAPEYNHIDVILYYEPGRKHIKPAIHPLSGRPLTWEEWRELTYLVRYWYMQYDPADIERQAAEWTLPEPEIRQPENKTRQRHGWIYVLKADRYYKIGQTINLNERFAHIEPQLPFPVEIIHTFAVEDMNEVESALHARFADKRTHGEWFTLDEHEIAWLTSLNGVDYDQI